jgi:nucleotide-binding universal stress UspA family protein
MKKILLVINAFKPDTTAIEFACRVAALADSGITGLLVENLYDNQPIITLNETAHYETVTESRFDAEVNTLTQKTAKIFLESCRQFNVSGDIVVDKGEPIQKVIGESHYADLLILNPGMSFYEEEVQLPSHFTKEILANAECPVLLAPDQFSAIDEIVFCYDGSASAVYAIKQFTYLFSGLSNTKLVLLEVNFEDKEAVKDDTGKMLEWLNMHYNNVTQTTLNGNADDALFAHLLLKTKKLVVMGAYGRNLLSTFFKRSTADILIRTIDLPVFIAHR